MGKTKALATHVAQPLPPTELPTQANILQQIDGTVLQWINEKELKHFLYDLAATSAASANEIVEHRNNLAFGSLQKTASKAKVKEALSNCSKDELIWITRFIASRRLEDGNTILSWQPQRKPKAMPASSEWRSKCFHCNQTASETERLLAFAEAEEEGFRICERCFSDVHFHSAKKIRFNQTMMNQYFGITPGQSIIF